MVNLFEEYPAKSAKNAGVNLFDEYNENTRKGTPEQALQLVKQQIGVQHPNIPHWLTDALLAITPKNNSPGLEAAAKGIGNVTNLIPAAIGGGLQGASLPIRGIAGLIPTDFTQKLAESPDLRTLFPQMEGTSPHAQELSKAVETGSELLGGGSLFNKLFQGAKYATEAAKLPKVLQTPTALATAGAVGTPGGALERTAGGAGALALGGAGKIAQNLPGLVKGLFSDSTPEALVQAVQKPHDILERGASELYDQVRSAIKKRGIKIPMNEDFLEQAKEYFPQRTTSTKDLFQRAKEGDYDAIHEIQSSLYTKGTKQLSGDDLVKENEGKDILDLRKRMNDFLQNHLIKEGHLDIAHVLKQGKDMYFKLMNTYYPEGLPKSVSKMVQSNLRLIPENPQNIFKQNSVPMKNFLQQHPEVAEHVESLAAKDKAIKSLKNLGYVAAGGGGTLAGIKTINDLMKD